MNIHPILADGVCLNVNDSRIAKYVQIHGIFRNILGILVGLYPESSRTAATTQISSVQVAHVDHRVAP